MYIGDYEAYKANSSWDEEPAIMVISSSKETALKESAQRLNILEDDVILIRRHDLDEIVALLIQSVLMITKETS